MRTVRRSSCRDRAADRGSAATLQEAVGTLAREAPVAEDLRLVMTLIQLAQHQALIGNQFELIGEQLASIRPGVAD
jgi:phosphate uptake regulator